MPARFPGMGGHQIGFRVKDEWLTPPAIIDALGGPTCFDLDPCAPCKRPWDTALNHYTEEDDGLDPGSPWKGRVWLNPPYSTVNDWMDRLAGHGYGTALVFARTETDWFHDHVWGRADAVLFLRRRVTFHHVDGSLSDYNAGAPSVLVAYGAWDRHYLQQCGLTGRFLRLR